jgi:hypothetical protein
MQLSTVWFAPCLFLMTFLSIEDVVMLRIPCFLSVLFLVTLELSSEQVWAMHGYNGCKDF